MCASMFAYVYGCVEAYVVVWACVQRDKKKSLRVQGPPLTKKRKVCAHVCMCTCVTTACLFDGENHALNRHITK